MSSLSAAGCEPPLRREAGEGAAGRATPVRQAAQPAAGERGMRRFRPKAPRPQDQRACKHRQLRSSQASHRNSPAARRRRCAPLQHCCASCGTHPSRCRANPIFFTVVRILAPRKAPGPVGSGNPETISLKMGDIRMVAKQAPAFALDVLDTLDDDVAQP